MTNDVRSGGSWTRRQRLKNAAIRGAVRLALVLVDRLPARALLAAGRALGVAVWLCCRSLRRTARQNVERVALTVTPDELVRRSFIAAGENLAMCLLLRRSTFNARECVHVDQMARQCLAAAHEAGRGVVFVSAHLGPFELLAATIAELGYEPAIVVRESYDPALNAVVDRHRQGRRIEVIHRGRAHALTCVLRALRAGRPVGILPDLGGRVRSMETDFLGGRIDFPVGPARIAMRSGAAVVVGTLLRESTSDAGLPRFRLRIVNVAADDTEPELTRRIAAELGRAVAGCPGDWLWMGARIRTLQENRTHG